MPIQGKKRIELTIENILKLISSYDIFRFYVPDKNWELNKITYSSFREEKNPSMLIGNRYGDMYFIDFGDSTKRGDCFSFVKQLYSLSTLDDVLRKIDTDFKLGLSGGVKGDYKKIVGEYKQPEVTKRNTLIQIVTRKFTKEETSYWNSYHQDVADLKENNIYSIKTAYLNKKIYHLSDLRFGYFYPEGGWWKIYSPYSKNRKRKWIGNVPLQTSWGLENLNKDYNSLITKSLKDYMVCRKIFPYVCGVQNESLGAFSEEFVENIKNNSKVVYYGGDSDNPGKQASYIITKAFGFRHINPPDNLLPDIKDMADWGKYNLESLSEHFIKKGLIN